MHRITGQFGPYTEGRLRPNYSLMPATTGGTSAIADVYSA